ncbi:MAG: GPR1/FUN34/YaaH family transporter [Solirubrobacteraceae bacterium]
MSAGLTLVARVACEVFMHSEDVCIMATISAPGRSVRQEAQLEGAPVAATLDWGNSAPLALLAFAVTMFILSMINAKAVSVGTTPVVSGVALMFVGRLPRPRGGRMRVLPGLGGALRVLLWPTCASCLVAGQGLMGATLNASQQM